MRLLQVFFIFAALAPAIARADYRETVPVLRIGIVDSHAAVADPVRLETVRRAYASALGLPVEIVRFRSYAGLIDAHASARVLYAIHSARSFAATQSVCGCVRALRRAVAGDGTTGFRSVLVVRESAGSKVADLRIAFSDEESVSGWQIPHLAMISGGLATPTLARAGSVGSVVDRFVAGQVDGFFGWIPERPGERVSSADQVFGGLYSNRLAGAGPLRISWLSEPVRHGPHAVHRSMPDDLAQAIGAFLDAMPQASPGLLDLLEPFHAGGFVAAAPDDYRSLDGLVGAR
ncbi:phosphonate transport system substrate-binding protein [Hoeflea marina]|uniref:Phosphonate transport system substrate-binding protein n=1 Tax=Hoeflea marina TaxID=274592 RepID=A0A317PK51_9HYPH|nr:PhnD/SsuA/transferrin family substrate-binding protein [Hoeflea marina]PWW00410.1 phosphonate transport system substrate-binding protein [Hoeflea marina]